MTEVVQPPLDGLGPLQDIPIPERPTPTAVLRGGCADCAQWPTVNTMTGLFEHHRYPKRDIKGRRGRCANVGRAPVRMVWSEPFK